VNEARRALLPPKAKLGGVRCGHRGKPVSLKSFDFVVYGSPFNLLVEIKGRKVPARSAGGRRRHAEPAAELGDRGRREGSRSVAAAVRRGFQGGVRVRVLVRAAAAGRVVSGGFRARFGRWYAVRAVLLDDYRREMKPRSERWKTVHVPTAAFERISGPLASASPDVPTRVSSAPRLQQEIRRAAQRPGRAGHSANRGRVPTDSEDRFARPVPER
jgi:hypothetical protein